MVKKYVEKKWILAKKISKKVIQKNPNLNSIILQLLENRKIKDKKSFLQPDFEEGLSEPFLLDGVKKARARILEAAKKKEKVIVFGHYDCDGICAAVLMTDALKKLKINSEVYIPSRKQGYQIDQKLFAYFKKKKISLIVTVDFGITDTKAAKLARKNNIDLIITDHHQPPKKLPEADVIINPHLSPKYPFKELCGAGVVYKLIQGLIGDEKFLKWSLDLVALATVADVVPLIGENRIFTKYGIIVLEKTKRAGLQKLYNVAGIDRQRINTYTIGFQIAPRLNASGRMDHASLSYYLLKTKDEKEAEKIAKDLNNLNYKRQKILDKSLKEALVQIKKDKLSKNKMIILQSRDWAEGVLGLIAGKVTEIFSRPSIVLREDGNFLKGSARSIDKFNIIKSLREYEEILHRVGGHKKAAGLTVKKSLMKDLYDKLISFANKKITDTDIIPEISIDAEVNFGELSDNFWQDICALEPYGYGNPKPIFASYNLSVKNIRTMSEGKHLSLNLSDGQNFFRAIGFGMGELSKKIKPGDQIDIAYNLDMNEWNGERNLELRLVDVKIK